MFIRWNVPPNSCHVWLFLFIYFYHVNGKAAGVWFKDFCMEHKAVYIRGMMVVSLIFLASKWSQCVWISRFVRLWHFNNFYLLCSAKSVYRVKRDKHPGPTFSALSCLRLFTGSSILRTFGFSYFATGFSGSFLCSSGLDVLCCS